MAYTDCLATRNDVQACYQIFLKREPESEAAIDQHLAGQPTVWDLVSRFKSSEEALRDRFDEACAAMFAQYDGRGVDIELGSKEANAIFDHIKNVWSDYGRKEAYYSVLTNPKYCSENLDDVELEAFYSTGWREVESFQETCRRNGIEPNPAWSVLDFGCGVGRVGLHLSKTFARYIGVDISRWHLDIAKQKLTGLPVHNHRFMTLAESLREPIRFDVFYSMIVLQHNPPPIMNWLLDHFLERINPGGYAFFQVPCFLYGYSFDASAYLTGEGRLNAMEMHAIPQSRVFELLAKHGLTPVEVLPNPVIGPIGFSFSFFARKAKGTR